MPPLPDQQVFAPAPRRKQRELVALLFFVAVINYFDRQSLSVVAPRFQAQLDLSDEGYGHIVSVFLFASTIAYAVAGFISDALGTRRSMALFVGWWSLAEAATAFATSTLSLGVARFCLGLGEPGLWVTAPKAVGEYLDKPRRSFAIGIYTMGATVGAVVALPVIATVTTHLPWRSIFLLDGTAGLIWLPLWLWWSRGMVQNGAPAQALEARSGNTTAGNESRRSVNESGLRRVLTQSSTWRLVVARGMTDPVWYFYLFWFPKYLITARHLTIPQVASLGWVVYFAAGVGTLAGGAFSGWLIRRGTRAGRAYRLTMLISAALMLLSPLCALVSSSVLAIGIASIIAFAHMSWLVTLTATVVELYPAALLGKATGLIAAGSGFGGMLSSEVVAYFVTHGGYHPVFLVMAVLHPIAITLLWNSFPSSAAAPLLLLPAEA